MAPSRAGNQVLGTGRKEIAISLGDWLAALDDFRNWLIREAALMEGFAKRKIRPDGLNFA